MQIKDKELELSRRAEISLERLSEPEQNRVLKNIEKVLNLGLQPPYAAKLKVMKNTFLVRSGRDLRIIFSVEPGHIRVVDITTHDRLKHLSMIGR
ncbi:MAG: hypothetical protein AAGD25_32385 [Cyanobacteria bacterium P01_F01_bin.150]